MSSSDAGGAPASPPLADADTVSLVSPPDADAAGSSKPVKLRIAWDKDAATPGGKSSIRVLLDWFCAPANYARWNAGKSHFGENREALCVEIRSLMHAQGLVHRETANIRTQLSFLERSYDAAVKWLVQNGYDGRIPDAASVAANPLPFGVRATGKSDNSVEAYVLRGCRYFYVLDSVKRQSSVATAAPSSVNPSTKAPVVRTKPHYSWVLKENGITGDGDGSGGYESSSEAGGDESAGTDEVGHHGARNPHSERRGRVSAAANHTATERRRTAMMSAAQEAQRDMVVDSWRSFKSEQQGQHSYSGWAAPGGCMNTTPNTTPRHSPTAGPGREATTPTAAGAATRTPSGDGEYRAAAVGHIGCGTATFGVNPPFGGRIPPPADWPEHFPTQFYSWADFAEYLREFCAVTHQPFYARGAVTVAHHNRILAASHRGPPVPDEYQIYSKQFACTHGALRTPRQREGATTTSGAQHQIGCTARISAVLMMDNRTQRYYVDVALMDAHNHPIRPELYLAILKSRQITDPALLRVVEDMNARGEKASAIVARLEEILRETTGETCLLNTKDIHSIAGHLRTTEQAQSQVGETQDAEAGKQSAAEARGLTTSVSSDTESDSEQSVNRSKRRRVDTPRTNAAESSGTEATESEVVVEKTKKPDLRIKLSQLEVLLDVANCYSHMHNEISQIGFATLELLPETLSGFKHEIIQLSTLGKSDDVDFVLPRYVISGCEAGIVEFCRNQRLRPQHVAVRLEIQQPRSSDAVRVVTLRPRQLEAMRRFYLARHNVALARKTLGWLASSAHLGRCHVPASFDEYAAYTKDLIAFSLGLVPFAAPPVSGVYRDIYDRPVSFTDTVISAHIYKFGCTEGDIDLDCVKATLLGMHSRFHDRATFLNPSFLLERGIDDRCRIGSSYGAFLSSNRFVAGLTQLRSGRWGAAVLDCSKNTCALYAADRVELEELQREMSPLFHGYNLPVVYFEAPLPPSFPAVQVPSSSSSPPSLAPKADSGVLALLFVELTLQDKTWMSLGQSESLDYFRVRYMLQAIQVVTKLNVHEIVWS